MEWRFRSFANCPVGSGRLQWGQGCWKGVEGRGRWQKCDDIGTGYYFLTKLRRPDSDRILLWLLFCQATDYLQCLHVPSERQFSVTLSPSSAVPPFSWGPLCLLPLFLHYGPSPDCFSCYLLPSPPQRLSATTFLVVLIVSEDCVAKVNWINYKPGN